MTTLAKKFFYTPAEYLKLEEAAATKHEYRNGMVVPMSGGSSNHSLIANNVSARLNRVLKYHPCLVYNSDMRVLVKPNGLYTYPDVTVVCGKPEFAKGRNDTITNPSAIVEVLSSATRAYDRGLKFDLYRALRSLQEYVLIDQKQAHIDYFRKGADGIWELEEYDQLTQRLALRTLAVTIALADIYDKVDWAAKPSQKAKRK